jgi:hypothetical protein
MRAVCMVGVNASAGMSNDETTQKKKRKMRNCILKREMRNDI